MLTTIIGIAMAAAPIPMERTIERTLVASSTSGCAAGSPGGAGPRGGADGTSICGDAVGGSRLPTRLVTRVPGSRIAQEDAENPEQTEEQSREISENRQIVGSLSERSASVGSKPTASGGYVRPLLGGAAYLLAGVGWMLLLAGRTRGWRIHGLPLIAAGIWLILYLVQA